jgi:hypothetical protein
LLEAIFEVGCYARVVFSVFFDDVQVPHNIH